MRKGLLVKIKSWIQEEEEKNVKYDDAIKYFSFVM